MARGTAESLLRNRGFDAKDMAKTFAEEYHRNPGRDYGSNVVDTFDELRNTKYEDPFSPAKNSSMVMDRLVMEPL